jgi:hypothetical protein
LRDDSPQRDRGHGEGKDYLSQRAQRRRRGLSFSIAAETTAMEKASGADAHPGHRREGLKKSAHLPVFSKRRFSVLSVSLWRKDLDVAKVSEVADPRRPGRSRINILRALDNKGDAASQTFPKGKN